MRTITSKKKGQVFTIDFIIGLLGFIFLVLIAFKLIVSIVPNDDFKLLNDENIFITDMLMQQGYPDNWTDSSVIIPGITTDNRLNKTKLEEYDKISYPRTKGLLHIRSDYSLAFYDGGNPINISGCVHGYSVMTNSSCHPQFDSLSYTNFVKTERFLIFNSSIIKMVVYSWS
ncbi:MAG: hypothetical protein ACQESE_03200 [Nanobdellota archaeon]